MTNLLNREVKVKLPCFKNLTHMQLFRDIDESIGTVECWQTDFINYCSLVGLQIGVAECGVVMRRREIRLEIDAC